MSLNTYETCAPATHQFPVQQALGWDVPATHGHLKSHTFWCPIRISKNIMEQGKEMNFILKTHTPPH